MLKVFFVFKMNKMEHHNFWKEHQNGNFKFNESFCDFTQNHPNFLYTQNGQKQSLNLKQALSKYITKLEIYKWNQSFGNST